MSYSATVYSIIIASPSDVELERDFARQVLYEWNYHMPAIHHVVLLPIMWETHASPEYGDRPQSFVNKQLLNDADLLVAVFRNRLGTPTGVAGSGTVEEIDEFSKLRRRIMIYFGTPQSTDASAAEISRLAEYKLMAKQIAYTSEFDTAQQFKDRFSQDILSALKDMGAIGPATELPKAQAKAAETSGPLISRTSKYIRRLKTEWELNQKNTPDMFQRACSILDSLRSVITELYAEINDGDNQMAIGLTRRALEQTVYLQNLTFTMNTDLQGYWRAGDDVFTLLQTARECLVPGAP